MVQWIHHMVSIYIAQILCVCVSVCVCVTEKYARGQKQRVDICSESDLQFMLSRRISLIFKLYHCKIAKISKSIAVYECNHQHLVGIMKSNSFVFI